MGSPKLLRWCCCNLCTALETIFLKSEHLPVLCWEMGGNSFRERWCLINKPCLPNSRKEGQTSPWCMCGTGCVRAARTKKLDLSKPKGKAAVATTCCGKSASRLGYRSGKRWRRTRDSGPGVAFKRA